MRTLVWFRGKDLRLADHPALVAAASSGEVVPLFVLDPYFFEPARARELPHRMQFLLASLRSLEDGLASLGSRLLVVRGKSVEVVPCLAEALRVDRVVAHRWSEPFARERDDRVAKALKVPFELFESETLAPPGSLRTGAGTPFSVFSAFARAFAANIEPGKPLPAPRSLPPLPKDVVATIEKAMDQTAFPAVIPTMASLGIPTNTRLPEGGEVAARARLAKFLEGPAAEYPTLRDRMDLGGTSRLSVDLKFGTLSVRTVWHAAARALGAKAPAALRTFHSELLWREFAHAMLWDRPELLKRPFRAGFAKFPWSRDESLFATFAGGRTGYPIVDAAARQLLLEGFVHNRARMIAASFMTKHLLLDYRLGEQHYMKHLVDGDWAANNMGWQWSAGCGCDAQPYFRVFNPVTQGERFDPEGNYVRRWIPELAKVPTKFIHQPWRAPPLELASAGVRIGATYPAPIVELAEGRERFLAIAKGHLDAGARGANDDLVRDA